MGLRTGHVASTVKNALAANRNHSVVVGVGIAAAGTSHHGRVPATMLAGPPFTVCSTAGYAAGVAPVCRPSAAPRPEITSVGPAFVGQIHGLQKQHFRQQFGPCLGRTVSPTVM